MSLEKEAVAAFWSHKRFWLFQTLAIAVWTALALSWFWLPDSRVWGIALAALQGLVVICGCARLIGSTLLFYRRAHLGKDEGLRSIYMETLRRVPALLVWPAILALALWATARPKAPGWIWIIPAILPPGAQVSAEGLRGLFRTVWRLRSLPGVVLLVTIGSYVPDKLIGWHPQLTGHADREPRDSLLFRLFVSRCRLGYCSHHCLQLIGGSDPYHLMI